MRFCAKKGNLWLCKMMLIPRNVEPFPKEATNGAPATRSRCHQSQYLLPPHLSFSLRPACYEPLRLRIHLATKDLHKRAHTEVYNDSYKDKHQLLRSSCKQLWPTTWTILVTGRRVNLINFINKPAATWPDASDKFMTEATSRYWTEKKNFISRFDIAGVW